MIMDLYFEFAGACVRVVSDEELLRDDGFLSGYSVPEGEPAYTLHVQPSGELPPPSGELIVVDPASRIYRDTDTWIRYWGVVERDPGNGYMWVSRRDDHGTLRIKEGKPTAKMLLRAMEIEHLLAGRCCLILHASYINCNGHGILFTAPSGVGKSTQARLWCEHMNAQLINGDRAIIRVMDGQAFACGIPYCGSSQVNHNVRLPLAAVVYLSQAPENCLTRLTGVRAFRRLWEGCSVHTWNVEDVQCATQTVMDVLSCTPVYHLACLPDESAVRILHQELEKEGRL